MPEGKQALIALAHMWEGVVQQIEASQEVFSLLAPKRGSRQLCSEPSENSSKLLDVDVLIVPHLYVVRQNVYQTSVVRRSTKGFDSADGQIGPLILVSGRPWQGKAMPGDPRACRTRGALRGIAKRERDAILTTRN